MIKKNSVFHATFFYMKEKTFCEKKPNLIPQAALAFTFKCIMETYFPNATIFPSKSIPLTSHRKTSFLLMNKYMISVLQTEKPSIKLKPSASDNDRNVGQGAIPVAQICC